MLSKILISSVVILSISTTGLAAKSNNFIALTDDQLSEVEAQALMTLTYIAPNDSDNKMLGQNMGFYKLGFESLVEVNANIRKLQLGCGGINGAGGCDLDIDNLSLSGLSDSSTGRVQSSAQISNPFMEFAIKNPNSSSMRQLTGLRFSAEKVKGLLTIGKENSLTPNGINSFSGYMQIKEAKGTAKTAGRRMVQNNDKGLGPISGKLDIKIGRWPLPEFVATRDFTTNSYDLGLSETNADLRIYGQNITGTRIKSAKLTGIANINQIRFAGSMDAKVQLSLGPLNMKKDIDGDITDLKANVTVDQNLGFIHRLPLDNPFSLSLQYQQVHWPGADAAANRGWWLAFDDAIDIGNVTPSQKIQITDDVLKQIIGPISKYLDDNPVKCNALQCIGGSSITIGNIPLPGTRVNFPLKDLHLANQGFAPNCYGGLKFC